MVRITSETCSMTCTARSASKDESRNGYGKRSRSQRTSARLRALRSMPIEPGYLLMPQPTSSVRAGITGPSQAGGLHRSDLLEAFLQCIHSEVGLIAVDDERRAQAEGTA